VSATGYPLLTILPYTDGLMTCEAVFRYRIAGRRPATIFALVCGSCFLGFAISNDAPWWLYPPILMAFGLAGYAVLLNPQAGITIDARTLTVFSGSWNQTADLADITSVTIVGFSDGPPYAKASLKDGSSLDLPALCVPEKTVFIEVLRRHGVSLA
jgi:hypothetical protein